MVDFPLPGGFDQRVLRVPEHSLQAILHPRQVDQRARPFELREALGGPAAEETAQRLAEADRILALINDATRPTPTGGMLSVLASQLPAERTTLLVATGAHRRPEPQELSAMLAGASDSWAERTQSHDAQHSVPMEYGTTSRGTPVRINALVEEADLLLALSSVEPHYFAGLTGGWKSIVPGIAAYETIEANHSHAVDLRSAPLVLEGNPVHEDLREAAQRVGEPWCFGFQVVLDERHRPVAGALGPLEGAFSAMAKAARKRAQVRLDRPADVVVTIATPPLDLDFYQAHKALENARAACRPGGILLLVAACTSGLGPEPFLDSVRRFRAGSLRETPTQARYRLSDHKLLRLQAGERTAQQWLASRLGPTETAGLPLRGFADPQEALDAALRTAGRDAQVVVIPDGNLVVPSISSGGVA